MNAIGYMYRAPPAILSLNVQGDYSTDKLLQPITYRSSILYWKLPFEQEYISVSGLTEARHYQSDFLHMWSAVLCSSTGMKLCHSEETLIPPQDYKELTRQSIC